MDNLTNETVSRNLKLLRLILGLNQEEFGERIGFSRPCISAHESKNICPNAIMLYELSKLYNLKIDDFYILNRSEFIKKIAQSVPEKLYKK